MKSTLEHKIVIITGASSGIGEATAYAFAKHRCKLVIAARSMEPLLRVKHQCEQLGATVHAVSCDVSIETDCQNLIRETIQAIKERYPGYSLAAFFEPRSATSARNTMYAEFVKSFAAADAVFIQEATKVNVPEVERLKVHDLVREVVGRGNTEFASSKKTIEELASEFMNWKNKKEKVLALVMSNGAFSGLNKKLMELVK